MGYIRFLLMGLLIATCSVSFADPTQVKAATVSTTDGTIIFKQLISVKNQNPNIDIYKVFYVSGGRKVEAFISEPKARGKYPLLLNLHGGWAGPQPTITHYSFGYAADSLMNASSDMVIVEPEYRGYMESSGTVQGLYGDTLDVQNAIRAAVSLGNIKANATYLLGYSMGGGVALNVASENRSVKALVAVSPFVGWDEYIHWMDNHPQIKIPSIVVQDRNIAMYWKNVFANDSKAKQENSLLNRIPLIKAPVLFLQGTGDDDVVWQTVQEFAHDMKKAKKPVKLVLYPHGSHGLHDQYQNASTLQIIDWFQQYGLSNPFPG